MEPDSETNDASVSQPCGNRALCCGGQPFQAATHNHRAVNLKLEVRKSAPDGERHPLHVDVRVEITTRIVGGYGGQTLRSEIEVERHNRQYAHTDDAARNPYQESAQEAMTAAASLFLILWLTLLLSLWLTLLLSGLFSSLYVCFRICFQ